MESMEIRPTKRGPYLLHNVYHSWRDRGYTTHFMTGIAWGEYQDYFTGKWDGVPHMDEGQVRQEGDTIWHGHQVPYIVPTENYLAYIKEAHVKKAIVQALMPSIWKSPNSGHVVDTARLSNGNGRNIMVLIGSFNMNRRIYLFVE